MNDIPYSKYIFNLDTMGHISIRNMVTDEIYDFDAHFEKLGIFHISFSFIDKTFASKFINYQHDGDELRITASFSFLNQDYAFVLIPRLDDVSLTPDQCFKLTLSGDIIEPSAFKTGDDDDNDDNMPDDDIVDELRLVADIDTERGSDEGEIHLCGRNELLDIMLVLSLRDLFVGYIGKVIPCDKFEQRILNYLDEEQQKFVLSVYHKDYRHNEYRMFEDASWSDRMKFLWIVLMLADLYGGQ
ncbi:MAG: hypothetical protein J6Y01_10470 [Spirochaetales bacterium]|nr:hypothetical protein [Spirochaetales bacterium]